MMYHQYCAIGMTKEPKMRTPRTAAYLPRLLCVSSFVLKPDFALSYCEVAPLNSSQHVSVNGQGHR